MTIQEKMKQVLAQPARPASPDFERLRDFYEEKKREGLIRKQEYTLPPMDTVGRTSCKWNWNQPLITEK